MHSNLVVVYLYVRAVENGSPVKSSTSRLLEPVPLKCLLLSFVGLGPTLREKYLLSTRPMAMGLLSREMFVGFCKKRRRANQRESGFDLVN